MGGTFWPTFVTVTELLNWEDMLRGIIGRGRVM